MIPCAPAILSFGTIARTFASGMITSAANQFFCLKCEMVGSLSDDNNVKTFLRFFFSTLSFSPTIPSAAMAPFNSMAICSIFAFFHGSLVALRLVINWVVDSQTVATIRNLLAFKLLPVSVNSTTASTRPAATLTSVAPQLN